MVVFDAHTHCRDKHIGQDTRVLNQPYPICDNFTEPQREALSTPSYRIRKEKKAGVLVSPKDITVIASVEDREPTFQVSFSSAQPVTHAPAQVDPSTLFVNSEQFMAMSDKWAEQFARFEALLSQGNVFSTPKTSVKCVSSDSVISDTPFLAPSAWPTGPVETLAELEAKPKREDGKDKKKAQKSRKGDKDRDTKANEKQDWSKSPAPVKDITGKQGHSFSPGPAKDNSGPEWGKQNVSGQHSGSTQISSSVPH